MAECTVVSRNEIMISVTRARGNKLTRGPMVTFERRIRFIPINLPSKKKGDKKNRKRANGPRMSRLQSCFLFNDHTSRARRLITKKERKRERIISTRAK